MPFLRGDVTMKEQRFVRRAADWVVALSVLGLFLAGLVSAVGPVAALDLSRCSIVAPEPITVFFESDRLLRNDSLHFGDQVNEPLDYTNAGQVQVAPGMLRKLITGGYNSADRLSKFASFGQMAEAVRAHSNGKKIVVFVHGCCTNFPLATAQAASLAEHSGATVVMYDWGSPLLSYGGSLSTYPRSQERFNRFMLELTHAFPTEHLSIVGFSMGNLLVDNFLLQYRSDDIGRKFDQLIFSRADMDSVAFRSHMARLTAHAKHTFVYSSSNDSQMFISSALRVVASPTHHGQRLGDIRSIKADGAVTVVDVSPLKLNHSIPYAVIAEFLASDGTIPASDKHRYKSLENGLVSVSEIQ